MQHTRFTEGFVTDEVIAYVETMSDIATRMRNKKPNTGTVFVSPPGYIYLPRALQQFLYLVLEASYARDLPFLYCSAKPQNQCNNMAPLWSLLPRFHSRNIQGRTRIHWIYGKLAIIIFPRNRPKASLCRALPRMNQEPLNSREAPQVLNSTMKEVQTSVSETKMSSSRHRMVLLLLHNARKKTKSPIGCYWWQHFSAN